MSAALHEATRSLAIIRLHATASLQLQIAAALFGKDHDELRRHFISSAGLMAEAAAALSADRDGAATEARTAAASLLRLAAVLDGGKAQ